MIELMEKVAHGKTNHKKGKNVKLSYEAQKLQFPNCLLLRREHIMPCPFTGPKMFWAGPIFCARPEIYLHIVAITKILCRTKS